MHWRASMKDAVKLMQKAIENLSTGFDLSDGESANLGLTVEGVAPGASLLPPPNCQQPAS
ncbi:hypothetical protein HO173_002930 [Letharia columbiana]|uniref:Uncharacterized protein n=1 Tax=Letharia columbiana TaxID=112416 RepID=A0A8H6L839_9LECA|nr:uncharacterized protein HO173_002930 [Letharia columbiana]KAF6239058.1 hypothetical protein HO173_002930 [Letharia columbiana]